MSFLQVTFTAKELSLWTDETGVSFTCFIAAADSESGDQTGENCPSFYQERLWTKTMLSLSLGVLWFQALTGVSVFSLSNCFFSRPWNLFPSLPFPFSFPFSFLPSLPPFSLSLFPSASKLPSGVATPSGWDNLAHLQTPAVCGGRASVEPPGAERKAPK